MSPKRILFLLSCVLFIGFVIFSYTVAKERYTQFDFDTTVKLQDHLSRRVDFPFSILSIIGSAEVTGIIWLGVFIFLMIKRYFWTALSMFLFWGAMLFEVFGKFFLYHPSPPFLFYRGVLDFRFPSEFIQSSYSYPSGHATRTTFLVLFLVLLLEFKYRHHLNKLIEIGLAIFLIAMYISRVYLGEHWATDVIGGALLGGSLAILTALTLPGKMKSTNG